MGDNGENVAKKGHYDENNLATWDNIANFWDKSLGNGNDMYQECLLPTIQELGAPQKGERALDLGTGSAVIAAVLATSGARVTAVDGSKLMLAKAEVRAKDAKLDINFEVVNLLDTASLDDFSRRHNRIVIVNLHPAFSNPAGHRAMEVLENEQTGKQEFHRHIKVSKYLDVAPVKSEALRGQPYPLNLYHRPFWSLLEPFFRNGLVMDAMREPGFTGPDDPSQLQSSQLQSYHNFGQFPMLLTFRLSLLHTSMNT
ncbi:methyltransferase type 11 [Colletotrichum kahawae]|uniref:Methyltransferase type 11 n=1 Tax=Colletotrichum kahawae TaxID=34407 RepID=A0AAD9YPS3_COLKA|nr:methyltransferase type 11 [Colletotrichum kahawae]